MATDPSFVIQSLLQGAGLGRTVADNQQQNAQTALAKQQLQLGQIKIADAQRSATAADQYTQDVAAYSAKPTLDGLVSFAVKHPEKAEQYQALWKLKDDAQHQGDLSALVPAYSAIDNNRPELAIAALQSRADAERRAGIDASELDQQIAALKSGDPAQINGVKGALQAHIAFSGKGPLADEFAKKLANAQEEKRYPMADGSLVDGSGKVYYQGGLKATPQKIDVFDANDTKVGERIVMVGGNDASSPPVGPTVGGVPVTATTPFDQVKQRIINHEAPPAVGGYNAVAYNLPGGKNAAGLDPVDLTGMTIGQVLQYQTGTMRPKTRGQRSADDVGSTGVGAYQLESGTLAQNAAKTFGKDWQNVPFTPANQDRIAETLWNDVRGDPNRLGNTWAAFKGQRGAPTAGQGRVLYDSTGGVAPASQTGDPTKTGDDYLASLPQNIRGTVQAVATGKMAQPSAFALTKPYWQNVMEAVSHYDPTFDSSTQPARVAAVKAFTGNGKAAQVASSGNRLAYHLNDLYRNSQALVGPDVLGMGWTGLNNTVAASGQSFQGPAVARYEATLPFIAGELQKLTKNGSATEGETKLIMANLSRKQSSETRMAAIQQIAELAEGQFKPFRNQWDTAFGDDRPPPVDFTPTTSKIFDHIKNGDEPLHVDGNGNEIPAAGKRAAQGQPASPGQPTRTATNPATGQKIGLVNGKWVPIS